jgi:hypothetical protein
MQDPILLALVLLTGAAGSAWIWWDWRRPGVRRQGGAASWAAALLLGAGLAVIYWLGHV